jgi:hypothetical protein
MGSINSWVDARLAAFAPVVAAAIMADDGPLVQEMQATLDSAVAQAMKNLPGEIAQAIKGLLPFPL